jgi:outer membrane murein-binding lipoprotein Lpp
VRAISIQRIAEINAAPRSGGLFKANVKLGKLSKDAKSIGKKLACLKEDYNATRQRMVDEKDGSFYAYARGFVQEMQASGVVDKCEIIKKADGRLEKSYITNVLKLQTLTSTIDRHEEKLEDIREEYGSQLSKINRLQCRPQ